MARNADRVRMESRREHDSTVSSPRVRRTGLLADRRRKLALVASVVLALGVGGLAYVLTSGRSPSRAGAGSSVAETLAGQRWILESIGRGSAPPTKIPAPLDRQARLDFVGDHRILCNDGAEGFDATYELSASTLTVSNVAGTLSGSSGQADPALLTVIGAMRSMFGIPGPPRPVQSHVEVTASDLIVTTETYTLDFSPGGPVPPSETGPGSLTPSATG